MSRVHALVCALVLLAEAPVSAAPGYTVPDIGPALSRGGAFVARADDATALYYNPAGAARIQGTHILITGNLLFNSINFQRRIYGDPKNPGDRYPHDPTLTMPEVTNGDAPFFAPFLGVVTDFGGLLRRINMTFMAGVYGPNGTPIHTFPRYCAPGAATCGDTTLASGLPSPARYETVARETLLLYPAFGLAWRPLHWLSVGAVMEIAWASMIYKTVIGGLASENPETDLDVRLDANSRPTVTGIVGAHVRPHDNFEFGAALRFGFNFTMRGPLCIGSFDSGPCPGIPASVSAKLPIKIRTENNPADVEFDVPKAWVIRTGARYINRDALRRERFDIELDFVYQTTSVVDTFALTAKTPMLVYLESNNQLFATVKEILSPHRWNNSFSLRLGGSYQFHDLFKGGSLVLRAGGFYESEAVPYEYTRLDFTPFSRFAVTAGAGLRWRWLNVDVGYAKVFHSARTVAPPEGQAPCGINRTENCGSAVRQIVPLTSAFEKYGGAVGNGTYRVSFDQLTLAVGATF